MEGIALILASPGVAPPAIRLDALHMKLVETPAVAVLEYARTNR